MVVCTENGQRRILPIHLHEHLLQFLYACSKLKTSNFISVRDSYFKFSGNV